MKALNFDFDNDNNENINKLIEMPGTILRAYEDENSPLYLHIYLENEDVKVFAGVLGIFE